MSTATKSQIILTLTGAAVGYAIGKNIKSTVIGASLGLVSWLPLAYLDALAWSKALSKGGES